MTMHSKFPGLICVFLLAAILLTLQPVMAQDAATGEPTNGEQYVPLTFTVDVDSSLYTNPFDSNDIEVLGIFRPPQSGDNGQRVVPGFWMQPYDLENHQPQAVPPQWQVRFTPDIPGDWSVTLQVWDDGLLSSSTDFQFTVVPSQRPGFITLGPNGHYFQFTNGQPYFPIGHNLNWSWDGGGDVWIYERWFDDLAANGGNYARLIIDTPWFIGLEWDRPVGDYRRAQEAAAKLDLILDMAAQRGIYLQLVMLWHQTLRFYNGPPVVVPTTPPRPDVSADWDNSPYNALNGGPLSGPGIFYSDEEARQLFQRRLRYIVSRWGYSPSVFAWEIIDIIDRAVNYDPQVAVDWLNSNINYVRQIDQFHHLITAGSQSFEDTLAGDALLSFTEGVYYQRRPLETISDQVTGVLGVIRRYQDAGSAPTMLVDYSLNPWFEPTADDPTGVHFQNTLWATALSGAAGAPASDWWDTYVIPLGLSRYYGPLAAFVSGINWPMLDLQPADAALLPVSDSDLYQPVRVTGFAHQFQVLAASDGLPLHITADGIYPDPSTQSSYLYGQTYSTRYRQPHSYIVSPPVDTYLEVRVRAVSSDFPARLVVTVDGTVVNELTLSPGSRDVSLQVALSAGQHSVTLDNQGDDWLDLDYLEVGQLIAPVRVLTLRDSSAGVALAWLQNRQYTWENVAAGAEIQPYTFRYRLDSMPPGHYTAEIWDPLSGTVLGQDALDVGEDGILTLDLLPVQSQLALRIFRQPIIEPTPVVTATSAPSSTPISADTPEPTATDTPAPTVMPEPATRTPTEESALLPVNTNTPHP